MYNAINKETKIEVETCSKDELNSFLKYLNIPKKKSELVNKLINIQSMNIENITKSKIEKHDEIKSPIKEFKALKYGTKEVTSKFRDTRNKAREEELAAALE